MWRRNGHSTEIYEKWHFKERSEDQVQMCKGNIGSTATKRTKPFGVRPGLSTANPRRIQKDFEECKGTENMEEDDTRCKRSDGKQRRCHAVAMPGKTLCEKHYFQLKRRTMNAALRAKQKKLNSVKATGENNSTVPMAVDTHGTVAAVPPQGCPVSDEPSELNSTAKIYRDAPKIKVPKNSAKIPLPDCSGRNTGAQVETESWMCHQCKRNDKGRVVRCSKCKRKRYCLPCITRWYPEQTEEEKLNAFASARIKHLNPWRREMTENGKCKSRPVAVEDFHEEICLKG